MLRLVVWLIRPLQFPEPYAELRSVFLITETRVVSAGMSLATAERPGRSRASMPIRPSSPVYRELLLMRPPEAVRALNNRRFTGS